jgi:hypothetical protein
MYTECRHEPSHLEVFRSIRKEIKVRGDDKASPHTAGECPACALRETLRVGCRQLEAIYDGFPISPRRALPDKIILPEGVMFPRVSKNFFGSTEGLSRSATRRMTSWSSEYIFRRTIRRDNLVMAFICAFPHILDDRAQYILEKFLRMVDEFAYSSKFDHLRKLRVLLFRSCFLETFSSCTRMDFLSVREFIRTVPKVSLALRRDMLFRQHVYGNGPIRVAFQRALGYLSQAIRTVNTRVRFRVIPKDRRKRLRRPKISLTALAGTYISFRSYRDARVHPVPRRRLQRYIWARDNHGVLYTKINRNRNASRSQLAAISRRSYPTGPVKSPRVSARVARATELDEAHGVGSDYLAPNPTPVDVEYDFPDNLISIGNKGWFIKPNPIQVIPEVVEVIPLPTEPDFDWSSASRDLLHDLYDEVFMIFINLPRSNSVEELWKGRTFSDPAEVLEYGFRIVVAYIGTGGSFGGLTVTEPAWKKSKQYQDGIHKITNLVVFLATGGLT